VHCQQIVSMMVVWFVMQAQDSFEQKQKMARQVLATRKRLIETLVHEAYQRQMNSLDHLCRSVRSSIHHDVKVRCRK
jgi:hypothetical protein